MPSIPLGEFRGMASAPQAPRANPHATDGEFEAARNLAGSVAQLGQAGARIATSLDEVRQRAVESKELADLEMAKLDLDLFQDEFVTKREKDSHPENWSVDFEKEAAERMAALTPKELSARGQAAYSHEFEKWRKVAAYQVGKTSTAKSVQNTQDKWNDLYNRGINSGNAEIAFMAVAGMKAGGVVTEIEAEKKIADAIPLAEKNKAIDAITKNPFQALKDLKAGAFPGLHKDDLLTLTTRAEVEQNRVNIKDFNDLQAMFIDGVDVSGDAKRLHEQGRITNLQFARLQQDMRNKRALKPDAQMEQYLNAYQLASALAPEDAGTRKDAEARGSAMGLTDGFSETIQSLIKEKTNPKSPLNSPEARKMFRIIDDNFRKGVYGEFRELEMEKSETTGKMRPKIGEDGRYIYKTNKEKLLAAQGAFTKVYDYLGSEIRRSQKPLSLSEMQKLLTDYNSKDTTTGGSNLLLDFADTMIYTDGSDGEGGDLF